jgi:hypothetical protein
VRLFLPRASRKPVNSIFFHLERVFVISPPNMELFQPDRPTPAKFVTRLEVGLGCYESFPARQIDRAALLRQRMSTGENCSPSRPLAVAPQHPLSVMLDSSPVKRLDDLVLRLEREQGLRQDAEQRLQRVTSLAFEDITKYATAERELRSVDLTQKQQRLGTITTQVSGVPNWLGGIDVIRVESQIATLTKEIQTAGPYPRAGLHADLWDTTQTLKQVTDERVDLGHAMQWQWGLEQSRFHVGARLNDDRTGGQSVFVGYTG